MIKEKKLEELLALLWGKYLADCPYAAKAHSLYPEAGNDHIAFRSVNYVNAGLQDKVVHGITPIQKFWEEFGYEKAADYEIESKNIRAVHLVKKGFPKIFISEFKTETLEGNKRGTINQSFGICRRDVFAAFEPSTGQRIDVVLKHLPVEELANFFFFNPYVLLPTEQELANLTEISQYVAWVRVFGNMVNHFTLDVGTVKDGSYDIEFIYNEMKENGIPMKDEIEGVGSELAQTSTKAAMGPIAVLDKDEEVKYIKVPYAYYEVAERGLVRFEGFKAEQTKGLFDMTKGA